MADNTPSERERVILEVVDALGGKASFELIETMIRAQFRKRLRAALVGLVEKGLLTHFIPGPYELTNTGRAVLKGPVPMAMH